MGYSVKEIFFSLQGEGIHSGRAALFLRFAGCNLWDGREESRADSPCFFCDTDFRGTDGPGGGRFEGADTLANHLMAFWPDTPVETPPFVVITGGEPLLQLDGDLIDALHARGAEIAVESNGTLPIPDGIDWITVSPKSRQGLVQRHGNELKLLYPLPGLDPAQFEDLAFDYFILQPVDLSRAPAAQQPPSTDEHLPDQTAHGKESLHLHHRANHRAALAYVQNNPRWRLGVQLHKWLNIP